MGRIRISSCLPDQRRWQGKLGSHRNQIKIHPQHDTSSISSTRQGEQQIYFTLNNVPACPAILHTLRGAQHRQDVAPEQCTTAGRILLLPILTSPVSHFINFLTISSVSHSVAHLSCWHTSPSSQGQGAEPPQPHCRVLLQETLPGTAGAG